MLVNPYNKPADLLRINPRGLVPTLALPGGRSLYESNVVCEYLEERYAGYKPNILPPLSQTPSGGDGGEDDGDSEYKRARHRIWADYVGTRVIPAFHRFLQFQPATAVGVGDEADAQRRLDELRVEFRDTLLVFARELLTNDEEFGGEKEESKGPYFLGSQIGLADIALVPWAVSLSFFFRSPFCRCLIALLRIMHVCRTLILTREFRSDFTYSTTSRAASGSPSLDAAARTRQHGRAGVSGYRLWRPAPASLAPPATSNTTSPSTSATPTIPPSRSSRRLHGQEGVFPEHLRY